MRGPGEGRDEGTGLRNWGEGPVRGGGHSRGRRGPGPQAGRPRSPRAQPAPGSSRCPCRARRQEEVPASGAPPFSVTRPAPRGWLSPSLVASRAEGAALPPRSGTWVSQPRTARALGPEALTRRRGQRAPPLGRSAVRRRAGPSACPIWVSRPGSTWRGRCRNFVGPAAENRLRRPHRCRAPPTQLHLCCWGTKARGCPAGKREH